MARTAYPEGRLRHAARCSLRAKRLFNVTVGTAEELRQAVIDGDAALALVLPEGFDGNEPVRLTLHVDAAEARQTAMLTPLIEQTLLDVERGVRGIEPLFLLEVVDVQARSRRYIDFLVPGLLAMTIMQISIAVAASTSSNIGARAS